MKIKEMVKKRKMSVYKLAQEMNKRGGVSPTNVYAWARGKYDPSEPNERLLCEVLECSCSELRGW